jgi:hypothetical protein
LEKLISKFVERRKHTSDTADDEMNFLNKELRGTQGKIDRLFDSLAEGMVEYSLDFLTAVGGVRLCFFQGTSWASPFLSSAPNP